VKIILLILVCALIFGGGGFAGGWFLFVGRNQLFGHGDAQTEHKEAPPPKADPMTETPMFVNIGPLTVPVLGAEKAEQFVTILLALEVADQPTADQIRNLGPRLTDAFLTTLYGSLASGSMFRGGVLDVAQGKSRLVPVTSKVVGQGIVRDVLVQVVNQRPM
jgi:flagellar protein FliL